MIVHNLWMCGAGIGLIIPAKSGVTYSQQACGISCYHPELEGVYVPIALGSSWIEIPHVGCSSNLTPGEAEALNEFFAANDPYHHPYRGLTVDESKLSESMEAWIWVRVGPDFEVLDGYSGSAVLVYPNCD